MLFPKLKSLTGIDVFDIRLRGLVPRKNNGRLPYSTGWRERNLLRSWATTLDTVEILLVLENDKFAEFQEIIDFVRTRDNLDTETGFAIAERGFWTIERWEFGHDGARLRNNIGSILVVYGKFCG